MNAYHQYKDCIYACMACAAVCNHCASSCTQEQDVAMMARCIQLDMECAALCYATAQLMSLGSAQVTRLCVICADACEACAAECSKHDHEHCRECAALCTACANACRAVKHL